MRERFYLGTHQPAWLARAGVPLFVSARRLYGRRTLPRALSRWALDSGGFSELSLFSRWVTTPEDYVALVLRCIAEIGMLDWAAIQDWMCEPFMLEKTGLSLAEHQRRTIASYERLQELAPSVPWMPVLQGWRLDDYLHHADEYARRGHVLSRVGVGSVCRRQHTAEAASILRSVAGLGLRVHAFGVKVQGLQQAADALETADSMAWSFQARRQPPLPGHTHKNCANCLEYALQWLAGLHAGVAESETRRAREAERLRDRNRQLRLAL